MAWNLGYACTLLLTLGLEDPADSPPGFQVQVLRELRQLRQEVGEVRAMVEAMRAQPAQGLEQVGPLTTRESLSRDREDARNRCFARLRQIALSPTATREEVRKYVLKIVEASRRLPYNQTNDPQVAMLRRVGEGNVDLLVQIYSDLDVRDWGSEEYILEALKALVTEGHKSIILQALSTKYPLVEIVVSRGWIQDAKQTLITVLAQRPTSLPTHWISAVAALRDPVTYDDLKAYFVNGANRGWTYRAIRPLQGINLGEAVAAAWEVTRQQHPVLEELLDMAVIAAEYGRLDALDTIVDVVASMPPTGFARTAYRALSQRLRYKGGTAEVVTWYRKNRDRLVFDTYSKTFGVRREAGTTR